MSAKQHFTTEQARDIGDKLGIDWSRFDVEQFRMGLDVELEHGRRDPSTDVTGNDPILTGKIALAHLNEFADYYTRLQKMEQEADEGEGEVGEGELVAHEGWVLSTVRGTGDMSGGRWLVRHEIRRDWGREEAFGECSKAESSRSASRAF